MYVRKSIPYWESVYACPGWACRWSFEGPTSSAGRRSPQSIACGIPGCFTTKIRVQRRPRLLRRQGVFPYHQLTHLAFYVGFRPTDIPSSEEDRTDIHSTLVGQVSGTTNQLGGCDGGTWVTLLEPASPVVFVLPLYRQSQPPSESVIPPMRHVNVRMGEPPDRIPDETNESNRGQPLPVPFAWQ